MEFDIVVYLVVSVQEEFNIRGIVFVLRRVKFDLAIGIDIILSCDIFDLYDYFEVRINQGVGIICLNYYGRGTLVGLITFFRLIRMLEQTVFEYNISVQREVVFGVIIEIGYIQVEQDGIFCVSFFIFCRYIYFSAEVVSLRDLIDCIRLLIVLVGMLVVYFFVEFDLGII